MLNQQPPPAFTRPCLMATSKMRTAGISTSLSVRWMKTYCLLHHQKVLQGSTSYLTVHLNMQLTTFRSFNTKDKLYTRYIYIFGYMLLCHLHTVLSRKMHLLLSTENEFWLWHLSFKYFRKLYYVSKLPASLSTQSWWGMRNPNYNSHDIIFDKNVHCCRRGNCSQPTKRPSHWLLKVLMLSLVNMIIGFQVMFSLGGPP